MSTSDYFKLPRIRVTTTNSKWYVITRNRVGALNTMVPLEMWLKMYRDGLEMDIKFFFGDDESQRLF